MTVAGSLGLTLSENDPVVIALEAHVEAPPATPEPSYEVLPERSAPSEGALLERRLAALAAAVEARGPGPADGLVAFDVEGLAAAIGEELHKHDHHAQLSVHVRDLRTQHVLFDYIGDTPLIPASNQKILTASAALDLLGTDYTFATEVYQHDKDLYLRGTGDPTLDVDDLNAIASLVAEKIDPGSVERLVIDDSAFTKKRFGPGYDKEGPGWAYQAPSGALSLNHNTVVVTVRPIKGEKQPEVTLDTPGDHFEVVNNAWVGRRGGIGVRTRPAKSKTVVEVAGTMSKRSRARHERRRVADPGMYTGSAFAAVLAEHMASEPLPVSRGVVPDDAEELLVNESAPLIEVLDSGLAYSNNFIAEQVLRTMAWRMTGTPGDWKTGQQILRGYWSALGNDPGQLVVENASGLSRTGRVTTAGLVDLISVAYRTHEGEENLIDALPVAGEAGTLKYRLRMSGKRIRAKTGTLRGVSGLSGVITSEAGEPQVAFSILINAEDPYRLVAKRRRRIEDRIVTHVLHALDDFEARRSGIKKTPGK